MLNSVNIQGRLTATPELKQTKNGKGVCNFCLANEVKKDETVFINCTAWGGTAELICNKFEKGNPIIVSGYLSESKYKETKSLKVTVSSIAFELSASKLKNKSNNSKNNNENEDDSKNEDEEFEEIEEDNSDLPF